MRISYLNQIIMTYELLVLELDPNRRDGEGAWRMDDRVEEKEGGSETGEEGGSEAGRRKEERVGPSNQARHSSSILTPNRYNSGLKI